MTMPPNSEQAAVRALFEELVMAKLVAFPQAREQLEAPKERGVYIIYGPDGRVLHVGRTPRASRGIHQRLYDHLQARSSFTIEHLKRDGASLRKGYKFRCLVVPDNRLRALLEFYATGYLCPVHLGLGHEVLPKPPN
jgi:hypothetical protein